MHACLASLLLLLVTAADAAGDPTGMTDMLRRIQSDRNLDQPGSEILDDRHWADSSTQASLDEYIRARQAIMRGQTMVAYGLLTSSISLDPDNAAAWRQLALLREREGQYEQAQDAWKQVQRINPGDLDALRSVGMMTSLGGNMRETARLLIAWRLGGGHRSMDRTSPYRNVRAEAVLAVALDAVDEPVAADAMRDSAKAGIRSLVQGGAGYRLSIESWLELVATLHGHGANESAFDAASLLIMAPHVNRVIRRELLYIAIGMAILYDDGQDVASLLATLSDRGLLDQSLDQPGQDELADSLYETATLFSNMGNQRGAAWLYAEVLELEPTNVMARNNLGYYELELGHLDRSVERLLESAWRDAPDDPAVLDSYGWLQYLRGRIEDEGTHPGALALLREAHDRSADEPSVEILDHLGDAYYRSGDVTAARASWTEALAILDEPTFRQAVIIQSRQLQKAIWGRRIRNPGAVYDLMFEPVQRRLRAKLAALDAGESCPVKPFAAETVE